MSETPASPALPRLALSVRQPWAWAILHGGKVIENRSLGSIKAGKMDCRRIALHAATGLKEDEYRWGLWKLQEHGVTCPAPQELPRGVIIGAVTVVDIISASDSPWFGSKPGNHGLVLEDPQPCEPIPAKGALGYFRWKTEGKLAGPKPWMAKYGAPHDPKGTMDLFPDAPLGFKSPPPKPWNDR